jgi:integrase
MVRSAKKALKGIALRGNVYHARLTIPKNARDSIGLVEFTQSLETSDLRVAETRGEAFIRDWKHQITTALGNLSPMSEVLLWKEELNKAKQDYVPRNRRDYSPVLDALHDKIESIATAENLERAKTFSDIVEGISIPSDSFVEAYLATRTVNSRSAQQEQTRIEYGTKAFPTFPINKQQVNHWAATLLQRYAHGTAKSIINNNAQYYQYLLDMGYLDPDLTNSFKDVRLSNGGGRKNGSDSKRMPWTANQVTSLIDACRAKGDVELLNITLLAAHTGARVKELASLLVNSIHLYDSIPYFTITKSKTNAGLRDVPIHPYIYTLLEAMVNHSTNKYLFPDLTVTNHNERSSAISKRFGRLKSKLGYGPNQVFHSFRHTAMTMLEQAGVPENITMDIVGHGKLTLTFGHYSGGTSMEQRYEAICKSIDCSFHNIPISELIG